MKKSPYRSPTSSTRLPRRCLRRTSSRSPVGIYNYAARLFAIRGLEDTQCGYKMYRGELADSIFGSQTLPGFGFDVEVLFLAQKQDARMEEIAIDWYYRQESKVSLVGGALGFIDIFRVRVNNLRGVYRDGASKSS